MDKIRQHALTLCKLLTGWQQFTYYFHDAEIGKHYSHDILRSCFVQFQEYFNTTLSLEVGAHEASFSQLMRKQYPDITVAAFEANPTVHKHFARHIPFDKLKILYFNKAVSNIDGSITFHTLDEDDGISVRSSLLHLSEEHVPEEVSETAIEVSSVRGDTFLSAFEEENIVLWVDVEGATDIVLKSFEKSFESRRISSLLVELESIELWKGQSRTSDIYDLMLGYDYLPVLSDCQYGTTQFNTIFVRSEDITADFITYVQGIFKVVFELFQENVNEL